MLSIKQNLLETIRGGNPDRFVNQYEYLPLLYDPILLGVFGNIKRGGPPEKNGWGVTIMWAEELPGPFPVHDEDVKVVKDITRWKEVVKAPKIKYSEDEWAPFVEIASKMDRNELFPASFVAPGLFEKLHYLMGMEDCLINFHEEPEAMHEMIDFFVDWEISAAKEVCDHLHPTALFHHDDWGTQISSFISPKMFDEFFTSAYKKIYSFWKANGVELIVHHSDSYAANLVPSMIEMGIDIWQGVMSTNDVPALVKQYGGKISFQGGIDNGIVDRIDWTKENIAKHVEEICKACGKHYFIPNTTMGGPESTYPGVYETVTEEINKMSKIMF